jgi:hypothetical protein
VRRAVSDVSAIDGELFKKGEVLFSLSGASSVILNTDVKNADINANFAGGSLLATGASLTDKQNIEGCAYVNGLTEHDEIRLEQLSGTLPSAGAIRPPAFIPEPGSIAPMLTGLAAITLLARRRRARAG